MIPIIEFTKSKKVSRKFILPCYFLRNFLGQVSLPDIARSAILTIVSSFLLTSRSCIVFFCLYFCHVLFNHNLNIILKKYFVSSKCHIYITCKKFDETALFKRSKAEKKCIVEKKILFNIIIIVISSGHYFEQYISNIKR
jgi:hypothetical protein